jgi:DNA mismatch repair ATPase MutS
MSNEDLTPVRKQYLEIKKEYPDTILFFRLGDFYETFDEDAEITARDLAKGCVFRWRAFRIMRLKIIWRD